MNLIMIEYLNFNLQYISFNLFNIFNYFDNNLENKCINKFHDIFRINKLLKTDQAFLSPTVSIYKVKH